MFFISTWLIVSNLLVLNYTREMIITSMFIINSFIIWNNKR